MIEVLEGGIQTTVQDFPGRQGLLDQGICPAGPFDNLAFRLANLLVGNEPGTAGLEITAGNFQARFAQDGVIALTGADMQPKLDGEPIELWQSHRVTPGQTLALGSVAGPGFRSYLAVSGGIDVPAYLGSRATYVPGAIGGFEGRALKKGDRLPVGSPAGGLDEAAGRRVKSSVIPRYTRRVGAGSGAWTTGGARLLDLGRLRPFFQSQLETRPQLEPYGLPARTA